MGYDIGDRSGSAKGAPAKQHDLSLESRRRLAVSGVEEVESFDEREVVMRCGGALLVVGGEELSVSQLSVEKGDVTVTGRIDSLVYEEAAAKRSGLFGRVFRG